MNVFVQGARLVQQGKSIKKCGLLTDRERFRRRCIRCKIRLDPYLLLRNAPLEFELTSKAVRQILLSNTSS